jgi:hypothetical protein
MSHARLRGTNPPGEAQPELNERFALLSSTDSDLHGRGKPESDHRLAKPVSMSCFFQRQPSRPNRSSNTGFLPFPQRQVDMYRKWIYPYLI